ncbi:hypothetical protein MJO28_000459 [Puccinia striiformis f. sp. tritici]|uniref:Uncharacterized protein n=1 Tax=Puccinia striiformis f. sp. tritici TaxID=168172 RepID=A0ACC0EZP7_9BASI|nr:hypothetical protein MJO28_000459 [Puccinia striiformis f. sp. tritici]
MGGPPSQWRPKHIIPGGGGHFHDKKNGSEKAQRDGALSRLRASANKCKNVGVSPPWDGEMDDSAVSLRGPFERIQWKPDSPIRYKFTTTLPFRGPHPSTTSPY